jgi:hypothetical protein
MSEDVIDAEAVLNFELTEWETETVLSALVFSHIRLADVGNDEEAAAIRASVLLVHESMMRQVRAQARGEEGVGLRTED